MVHEVRPDLVQTFTFDGDPDAVALETLRVAVVRTGCKQTCQSHLRLVKAWLAKEPADHAALHPDGRSWLNMVEIFFGIITRQAILHLGQNLVTAIGNFIDGWNDRCQPSSGPNPAKQLLDHYRPGERTSFARQESRFNSSARKVEMGYQPWSPITGPSTASEYRNAH